MIHHKLAKPKLFQIQRRPIATTRLRVQLGKILGISPRRLYADVLYLPDLVHDDRIDGSIRIELHLELYISLIGIERGLCLLKHHEEVVLAVAEAMERNQYSTAWMHYRLRPVKTDGWKVDIDKADVLDVVCFADPQRGC